MNEEQFEKFRHKKKLQKSKHTRSKFRKSRRENKLHPIFKSKNKKELDK